MDVESRDSVSLKPAERDFLAQVLAGAGSGFADEPQADDMAVLAIRVTPAD